MPSVTPQPAVFGPTGRLPGFGGAGLAGAGVEGTAGALPDGDVDNPTDGREVADEGRTEGVPEGPVDGPVGGSADGDGGAEADDGADGPDTAGDRDGSDWRPKCAARAAPPSAPATPSPTHALTNHDALTATSTTADGSRPVSAQSKVSCAVRRGMSSSTATPSTATMARATNTLCVAS